MPPTPEHPSTANPPAPGTEVPFGVNEVRLDARQWLFVGCLLLIVVLSVPRLWPAWERFPTGADYRIPYALSKDYWLYARRLRQVEDPSQVVLLGDSVVWGEYVLPDGTLSHFLNQAMGGGRERFINGGVNGMFPLALEGLTRCYGGALRGHKVLLHCNVLWMTSPKADLSAEKEEQFNHSRLVPQFAPRVPCYKADANTRLTAIVERNVDFLGWINHLQSAYFDEKSLLSWTLADDGNDPPQHPNSWKNPLSQIGRVVPTAPRVDPQRGPQSPRHKAWSAGGADRTQFDWVDLDRSLQWQAFQRLAQLLRERGNDVFVVLGPFNEDMMREDNRAKYRAIRDGITSWLAAERFIHAVPKPLPSALYADASHPLTEGYDQLAQWLSGDASFRRWLGEK